MWVTVVKVGEANQSMGELNGCFVWANLIGTGANPNLVFKMAFL